MLPPVILRKTSLVDYPGRVSSVIFLPGCNLRCPWCQNRELVLLGASPAPGTGDFIPPGEALSLIGKRRNMLGGVVISGGEPALHPALGALIGEIHGLGLPVKLDTNGLFPPVLRKLLEDPLSRPDYIALDLKLAPRRYGELLPRGSLFDPGALAESAALLRDRGPEHEFRSLALPGFGEDDIKALAPLAGNSPWNIRPFKPGNCLDPAWDSLPAAGEKETAALTALVKRWRMAERF
jgi:pyruvate formate lyase activating enzyme